MYFLFLLGNKKNTNHCEKKEILERMNYLYQVIIEQINSNKISIV